MTWRRLLSSHSQPMCMSITRVRCAWLQVRMPDGNLLTTADGQQWRLLQFHFHTPSENALDGRHAPMEAHLVHQNVANGAPTSTVWQWVPFEVGEDRYSIKRLCIGNCRQSAVAMHCAMLRSSSRLLL